jgi:hypothetical protein
MWYYSKQSRDRETDSRSVSQKILQLLYNPKFIRVTTSINAPYPMPSWITRILPAPPYTTSRRPSKPLLSTGWFLAYDWLALDSLQLGFT